MSKLHQITSMNASLSPLEMNPTNQLCGLEPDEQKWQSALEMPL